MHHGHTERARYTGSHVHPAGHGGPHGHGPHHQHHHHGGPQGHCGSCCHPRSKCHCHCRECRKEAKELLVEPTLGRDDASKANFAAVAQRAAFIRTMGHAAAASADVAAASVSNVVVSDRQQVGMGKAFIGGGCCVHLSIEYAPTTPTATAIVAVLVDDSEGTVLAWGKVEQPGGGYRIKEGIITTKPGADLTVLVVNATARVRWCEIFSC